MLIYSHTTPESLQVVTKDYEFMRNSIFCEALNIPELDSDITISKLYNDSLKGDPNKIENFINFINLSGYTLDAHTLHHYVRHAKYNPIFRPYISKNKQYFYNFNPTDCLNSPCNYFGPISHNIGSIGDVANSMNFTTTPIISLTSIPTAFSLSIATLNKIPKSIKQSFGELTQLVTDTFKEVLSVFADDPKLEEKQKKAIESGISYRSDSISDVVTSDYRHYFDVSASVSDILNQISIDMGNCFNLFQYQHRYNPFDYNMNMQTANKAGFLHKYSDTVTALNHNGVPINGAARTFPMSNSTYNTTPFPSESFSDFININLVGNVLNMKVTSFGAYYDSNGKILYRDSDTTDTGAKANFDFTQAGKGHLKYRYTPSIEQLLLNDINNNYTENNNYSELIENKFNGGFAVDLTTLYNYFGTKVDKSDVEEAVNKGTLQANIQINNITRRVNIIDTKNPSGGKLPVIDITANVLHNYFNENFIIGDILSGKIDTSKIAEIREITGINITTAKVQFIIPGIYDEIVEETDTLPNDINLNEGPSGALLPPIP